MTATHLTAGLRADSATVARRIQAPPRWQADGEHAQRPRDRLRDDGLTGSTTNGLL